jgi:hypothetical protein
MKNLQKIVPYIFLTFSILFCTYFWDKIKIPYNNSDIIGIYAINEYHSLNDILRYLFFIFIPTLVWIISYLLLNKKKIKKFIYNLNYLERKKTNYNLSLFYIFFIILIILLFQFFSLDFNIQKIDLVHEGQQLSSAFRNYYDNSLWSKSYVIAGIFYETINAKLFWNYFDKISIGSFRISIYVYTFGLKILLLILAFKIANITNINNNLKTIFFFFISLVFINFLDYDSFTSDYISYRDIPIIISLILIVDFFNQNKNQSVAILILSSLSLPTLMWSLDRGIVYNLIIIFLIFIILFQKKYKYFFISIITIILTWLFFYIILKNEFVYFFENSKKIISQMNYIHGIIHPTPFSDEPQSSRATKTLILILINLIISIKIFFNSNKIISNNFKLILLFISATSVMSYLYALGRSDGPHIKVIFVYPLMFQLILIFNFILFYVDKKLLIKSSNVSLIFLLSALILYALKSNINFHNIKSFSGRLNYYVNLDDTFFLEKKEINLINKFSKLVNDEQCIQLYSNDVAILYLLKKKSCSKFYFTWGVGSRENQKILISELKENNYIIAGGPSFNWDMSLKKKLPLYNEYITKNYILISEINNYQLLKKIY